MQPGSCNLRLILSYSLLSVLGTAPKIVGLSRWLTVNLQKVWLSCVPCSFPKQVVRKALLLSLLLLFLCDMSCQSADIILLKVRWTTLIKIPLYIPQTLDQAVMLTSSWHKYLEWLYCVLTNRHYATICNEIKAYPRINKFIWLVLMLLMPTARPKDASVGHYIDNQKDAGEEEWWEPPGICCNYCM